jgi:hypothetical protein
VRPARTLAASVAALAAAACGGGSQTSASTRSAATGPVHAATVTTPGTTPSPAATTPTPPPRPAQPSFPVLLGGALVSGPSKFVPVVRWRGQTAVLIRRTPSGIALLSFDQRVLQVRLHSGTTDAGTAGWRFGPSVAGAELKRLVAGFNGGFKFSTGAGGFMSYGHVALPLRDGLGSIVIYAGGNTDIGTWHRELPPSGRRVVSVRQNLQLLIDHGSAAPTLGCLSCWGATLGGVIDPARSALGITTRGNLIWAGGERVTVSQLADALLGAHVVRAVELDINPEWVAGYLYGHRGGHGPPAAVAVVPGQQGIPGRFLAPWSRDFFTIVAR